MTLAPEPLRSVSKRSLPQWGAALTCWSVAIASAATQALAFEPEWERLHPTPFRLQINDIGWNGSQFLMAGEGGLTALSENGIDWEPVQTGPKTFARVAWFAGQWVGVGAPLQMISTSPDGMNWTRRHGAAAGGLNGIAMNDTGRLVAVGSLDWTSGLILISDDNGVTWFEETFDGPSLQDVVWTGDGFYAAGGVRGNASVTWGGIWFSADGIDWEMRYDSPAYLTGIAWNGSRLVAAGRRFEPPDSQSVVSFVLSSGDGENWNVAHEGSESVPQKARWLGDAYYVVGTGAHVLRSTDSLQWTTEALDEEEFVFQINGIAGSPEMRVAGGLAALKRKTGADPWQEGIHGHRVLFALATDGNQTIAVSVAGAHSVLGASFSRGTIYNSTDGGRTLSLVFSNPDISLGPPVFHDGLFIVPAGNGTALTSPDGQTWSVETTGGSRHANAIAAHEGTVVVVGSGSEIRHRNVVGEWTVQSGNFFASLRAVTRMSDRWIAVGSETKTSTDGHLWESEYPGTNQSLYGVASLGETTVAIGANIVTVRDATGTWTLVEPFREPDPASFSGSAFHSIVVFRGRFYLADLDGGLWSSWDGRNWRQEKPIPGTRLRRLDLVGEQLAVSGYWGDIIVSGPPPPAEGPPLSYLEWVEENRDVLPDGSLEPTDRTGPLDIPNLLAYGLGIIPSVATPADLPGFHRDLDFTESGVFEYRRNRRAEDLNYRVVRSHDLLQWHDIDPRDHRQVDLDAVHETWQVRMRMDVETTGFLRLEVSAADE